MCASDVTELYRYNSIYNVMSWYSVFRYMHRSILVAIWFVWFTYVLVIVMVSVLHLWLHYDSTVMFCVSSHNIDLSFISAPSLSFSVPPPQHLSILLLLPG